LFAYRSKPGVGTSTLSGSVGIAARAFTMSGAYLTGPTITIRASRQ
jgi:hypothetical protein